jgi:rare lipoprotein A
VRIAILAVALLCAATDAHAESGIASFYSTGDSGSRTASGERLDDNALTAAMRKPMPLGAVVRVTAANGRNVTVRINDRGPFVAGRIIDLTPAGARALGMEAAALTHVTVERIK